MCLKIEKRMDVKQAFSFVDCLIVVEKKKVCLDALKLG